MNFFSKIFSKKPASEQKLDKTKQTPQNEKKVEIQIKQETKPDISLLKCSGCKKEYVIGKDAVAVCLESQAPGTNILVVYDHDTERVDLVAPIDPSNKGAFERAKPGWKTIQDSLAHGQQRKWKCNLCNQVNKYPVLSTNLNEPSNQNLSTNEINSTPDKVIVHTYPNSKAQRLLGLSADNMLCQTYLSDSGRYIIEELGEIGSPDALQFLNEILVSKIYGKEIKGHAKRALNMHYKKTQNIIDKNTEVKYSYKCDNCSKESNDSGGYAFYSDVPMMGNMLFCKACTDQIITEYSFAAPRKYSGSFDLFSLKGNQLNEVNAEAIIARCKKFGFTPSQAKQKAKELGLEFHKDNNHGQDLIYEFWRSI